ncbi:TPA: glycerophosphodiester phosphodiesterase [Candidatus Woesearchaeota archaeon]|nr:glycerophosphodiester phosphodiesterase [Candidatus Woesearchaeota archaeon]HIH47076.1 glycerophosphodiester phosphodiesterase [Candidatus Woesearchaeota archaeon]HII89226.1 glycerophosphodiester phosphodiesterase [Candidatus Woesearchaeota archaeon]
MLKAAHRGASGYEPENTLRAFRKAIAMDADMIELDVRLSKDSEVVVFHDEKLDRMTGQRNAGFLKDYELSELKKFDVGKDGKPQHIPTLQEVFDCVNRHVKINIELKGENTEKFVGRLIEQYVQEKGWLYSDFIISSFDADRLKRFHDYSPKVKLGLICKKLPTNIRSLIKTIPLYSVHISGVFLTQRQVEALHNNGVKVLVWTVNGTNLVEKFKRWKADGLFSDYPDLLMKN